MQKGLVIGPDVSGSVAANELTIMGLAPGPLKLRQYALYWDILDLPTNQVIGGSIGEDAELLLSAGLLRQTASATPVSGPFASILLHSLIDAFHRNNLQGDVLWSLALPSFDLQLPSSMALRARTLEVELFQAIPVPIAETPMESVLDFRARRGDELLAYREQIGLLYQSAIASPDRAHAKALAIDQLQRKALDLNRVMREAKLKRFWSSVKVELSMDEIASALAGVLGATSLNLPAIAGLAAPLASRVVVSATRAMQPRQMPEALRDFAYVYHAGRELSSGAGRGARPKQHVETQRRELLDPTALRRAIDDAVRKRRYT